MKRKKKCRSPGGGTERLSAMEIRGLVRHDAYERGANGRMRSRGGVVVIK